MTIQVVIDGGEVLGLKTDLNPQAAVAGLELKLEAKGTDSKSTDIATHSLI